MNGTVLVTNSLLVDDDHIKQIEAAGYKVERIENAALTEDELIAALQGKVGYMLRGIEKVTAKVIQSADQLKVISFTGADWQAIMPGWEEAKKKGIKVSNAPGGNSGAVAEFAVTMALAMQRNIFELGRTGDLKFQIAPTLQNAKVGVIGAGNIGSKIIRMVSGFGPASVVYYARNKHPEAETSGAQYAELKDLAANSDVILIAAPGSTGMLLDKQIIAKLKDNALVVSISPLVQIDLDAMLERLQRGRARLALDWPAPSEAYAQLPLHTFFNTNSHTAYATKESARICSGMGTESLVNLLMAGEDQYRVL